jgi:RNA polymerase sigma factor (sigma-70 family)
VFSARNLLFNLASKVIAKATSGGMRSDNLLPADDIGKFRTTRWSAVLLSAQSQAPGSQAALAELCRIYWYPIYALVRRGGYSAEDAQDLTQGFFLHILNHKTLRHVSPLKGRFRSFLSASLHNFLLNAADHARSLKRGGNAEFVFLDAESAEFRYQLESPDCLTPERMFDARWAITLLGEVVTRLREEYASRGNQAIFEALEPFLETINSRAPLSYEQAADALQVSVAAVKTLIHRLRKRYTFLLREEVGRTVSDPGEIDEELHALCEALISTEGRL